MITNVETKQPIFWIECFYILNMCLILLDSLHMLPKESRVQILMPHCT